MIRLHDVLQGSGGTLEGDISEQYLFNRVIHDSRYVQPGDLFVALRGEVTDGHLYVADARARGATAALVRRDALDLARGAELPLVVVDDTLAALHALATYWRSLFDLHVVGITGSIGKSSTKEVVGAVLAARYNVAKSVRSYNNEVGLPISVLEITPDTEVCVLEMGGAYAFGEITQLAKIARPTIGIVTVVSHSHLSRMGSLEAIAQTKTELVEALPPDGIAILNRDDERVYRMAEAASARIVTYGLDPSADYRAVNLESHGLGGISFTLVRNEQRDHVQVPLLGRHSVHTALAGIAVGFELGMSLEEIMRGFDRPNIQLRLLLSPGVSGSTLLDDTYNANPASSFAALALLQELDARRRVAVFGDMLELGDFEEEGHRMVGARIAVTADLFFAYGPRAAIMAREAREANPDMPIYHFDTKDALVEVLKHELQAGDLVLIKGSRGIQMETVVAALRSVDEQDAG
ncbi:MAG: UDP-N-acetylmuramoylalanyl-D-glutamate--2,6-diaminopimelate ligase [Chloroflexi bacterium]|nr:MAG: UDP-N-acetylmuramoylalanyl-D-glutamate--2,6-diaminopimelate ligase [Chloroflexota bacterium]